MLFIQDFQEPGVYFQYKFLSYYFRLGFLNDISIFGIYSAFLLSWFPFHSLLITISRIFCFLSDSKHFSLPTLFLNLLFLSSIVFVSSGVLVYSFISKMAFTLISNSFLKSATYFITKLLFWFMLFFYVLCRFRNVLACFETAGCCFDLFWGHIFLVGSHCLWGWGERGGVIRQRVLSFSYQSIV